MPEILSDSIQDYIKIIYELTHIGVPAKTSALASRLGISPASVTGMLQKLSYTHPPLVTYHKRQGVKLTAAGEQAALNVIRRHRLIEAWLVQTLDYSWDEVHAEAEKLEHVISEEFEMRIAASLGNPVRDPHGEPIPDANLKMPPDRSTPLASLLPEQQAIIRRVTAQEPEFLRYMDELGLVPGATVKLLSVAPYDQVMQVLVPDRKRPHSLGPAITNRVFVEIL